MSITIENPEFETILADVTARTGRDGNELLLDLLRQERGRLERERKRDGWPTAWRLTRS